jgi:hypothetical protein
VVVSPKNALLTSAKIEKKATKNYDSDFPPSDVYSSAEVKTFTVLKKPEEARDSDVGGFNA